MASSAASPHAKASMAGMVLLRLLLGLFFLYAAATKVFIFENLFVDQNAVSAQVTPPPVVRTAPQPTPPVVRTAPQPTPPDANLEDHAPAPANTPTPTPAPAMSRPAPTPAPAPALLANGNVFAPEVFLGNLELATQPDGLLVKDQAWPEVGTLLTEYVSPNIDVVGWALIFGEGLVGFLLLIGLFTRFAAVVGIVINLGYLAATVHFNPPTGLFSNAAFLAMELTVLVGNAGKFGGFDAFIGKGKKKAKEE